MFIITKLNKTVNLYDMRQNEWKKNDSCRFVHIEHNKFLEKTRKEI